MGNIDFMKESSLYPILTKEARVEGKRETIHDMLEGRFGVLSDDVIQALNKADEETLKDNAVHAGTDTLEQIRSRLLL